MPFFYWIRFPMCFLECAYLQKFDQSYEPNLYDFYNFTLFPRLCTFS